MKKRKSQITAKDDLNYLVENHPEIILKILSLLDTKDLISLEGVSKKLKQLAEDKFKELLQKKTNTLPPILPLSQTYKNVYINLIKNEKNLVNQVLSLYVDSNKNLNPKNTINIPNDILIEIFSFLDLKNLNKIVILSKFFKYLSESDRIWKKLFDKIYTGSKVFNEKTYKEAFKDLVTCRYLQFEYIYKYPDHQLIPPPITQPQSNLSKNWKKLIETCSSGNIQEIEKCLLKNKEEYKKKSLKELTNVLHISLYNRENPSAPKQIITFFNNLLEMKFFCSNNPKKQFISYYGESYKNYMKDFYLIFKPLLTEQYRWILLKCNEHDLLPKINNEHLIFYAIQDQDKSLIEFLSGFCPQGLTKKNQNGETPLSYAFAKAQHFRDASIFYFKYTYYLQVAKSLIEPSKYQDQTLLIKPLEYFLMLEKNPEGFKKHIHHFNNLLPNYKDKNHGLSALHLSLSYDNQIAFEYLLKNYPSLINTHSNEGNFPIHTGAKRENYAACKALLEKGADPNVYNNSKCTPLHFLAENPFNKKDIYILQLFIEKGANLLAKNEENKTPLMCALDKKNTEFIVYLIELGLTEELTQDKIQQSYKNSGKKYEKKFLITTLALEKTKKDLEKSQTKKIDASTQTDDANDVEETDRNSSIEKSF